MNHKTAGIGISAAARDLQACESTLRRLDGVIVWAARDSGNRRVFTTEQIRTLRAHLQRTRPWHGTAARQ